MRLDLQDTMLLAPDPVRGVSASASGYSTDRPPPPPGGGSSLRGLSGIQPDRRGPTRVMLDAATHRSEALEPPRSAAKPSSSSRPARPPRRGLPHVRRRRTTALLAFEEEAEQEVEIEINDEEAPFLAGQTAVGGRRFSPIKIVKNPDGSLTARGDDAAARSRRNAVSSRQHAAARRMLDSVPQDLNRPWEDPMPQAGETAPRAGASAASGSARD